MTMGSVGPTKVNEAPETETWFTVALDFPVFEIVIGMMTLLPT